MGKCKNYTLDCKQEEMGCKGCAYYKETAKTDVTYCTNEKCETKEECDRHMEHYKFDRENFDRYCFMNKCEEYQGGNDE